MGTMDTQVSVTDMGAFREAVLRHLKLSLGKDPPHASTYDWRVAISLSLRDLVVDPWFQSTRKTYEREAKRVYYLSMEFLIGRLLKDAAVNLGIESIVRDTVGSLDLDYETVLADEPDAALGNGGLGRLAACFMDSLASMGMPAYGYGIRYEHGLFHQHFEDGRQVETAETWLTQKHVWEFERPEVGYEIGFGGHVETGPDGEKWMPEQTVIARAYDTPLIGWKGRWANTLRLWSAKPTKIFDLDRFNRGEYLAAAEPEALARTISRVLYPDDTTHQGRELRLKQEYFFTAASISDILRRFLSEYDDLARLPEKVAIQLNDTHPAIAAPELVRILVDSHKFSIDKAIETACACIGYTNHTLLPEALETWSVDLFAGVLPRHYRIIQKIDDWLARTVGGDIRVIDHGSVRMGELAFVASHRVNGVSALHTDLMKKTVFQRLNHAFPDRIVNETNGVTPRRWLYSSNRPLRDLITSVIGPDWPADLERIGGLSAMADDAGFVERFAEAKRQNKIRLAEWFAATTGHAVDPASMFDIHIKRIHEYKRQLMNILETIALWNEIRDDPDGNRVPRVKVFAGKAAPGYAVAKQIIHLINDVATVINADPAAKGLLKVIYPENYSVSMAEILIPAADLSEQISTAGKEASGTGNMKLTLNGAITIGTLDGANIEIRDLVGAENFFVFGMTAEEVLKRREVPSYARAAIEADDRLRRALSQIAEGVFSPDDPHRYQSLVAQLYDSDYFMVTCDFGDYFDTQRKVDLLYGDSFRWHRSALLNVAHAGWFSSDRTIRGYNDDIWHVTPLIDRN
jgi:glycogen phosphorylase